MARRLVPKIDLAPSAAALEPIADLHLEHFVLGLALYGEEEALEIFALELKPESFSEPFHGRLFKRILSLRADGALVTPETLHELIRRDPAYNDLGGIVYLANLIDSAPIAAKKEFAGYAESLSEIARRRRLAQLGAEITALAYATADDQVTPLKSAEILDSIEAEIITLRQDDNRLALTSLGDAAEEVLEYVDDRTDAVGIHCGLNAIHDLIGPLLAGELYLLPGRPSMGKSAVASHIGLRIVAPEWWAKYDRAPPDAFSMIQDYGLREPESAGVLFINGEMSKGQMTRRHYADVGYAMFGAKFPTYRAIRDKHVSQEQRVMMAEVRDAMRDWPLQMIKRNGLKVSELRAIGKRQMAKWRRAGIKPGLMIIDHAGLLTAEGKNMSRYEAQTQISSDLHQLAEDLGLPIMALLQLSRGPESREDKRPQLQDLRDSGSWEQDADVVVFPFRDSYYAQREKEPPEGTFGSTENQKWAEWDTRCKSKAIEFIPGKVREGSTSKSSQGWIDIAWNAVRNFEPQIPGGMF